MQRFAVKQAAIKNAYERKWRGVALRWGGYARTIMQRSIKRPSKRRMPLASMSPQALADHKRKQRLYRQGKIKKKPLRPLAPAPAGRPPYNQTGGLKKRMRYEYLQRSRSVLFGIVDDRDNIAQTLELGLPARFKGPDGKTYTANFQKHPFIQPAAEKAKPKLLDFIRRARV